jgi:nucleoside-diphosphate-sugar epimerase
MRILMLGGTGVLSTDILNECISSNYEVYVLNRGHHSCTNHPNVHVIVGDIRNISSVSSRLTCRKYDVVIDFLSYNAEHLESTYSWLAGFCDQYIFLSSACVFRRAYNDGIIVENSPKPNQLLDYSINKYAAESCIRELYSKFKTPYTIVRPYITYGDTRVPVGIAPLARYHWTIIGRMLANKPFFIWGDGSNKCTLMHTRDFAYNFIQLLLNKKAYNEDVNLVGNEVHTWHDVLKLIYKSLNIVPQIIDVPITKLCTLLPEYEQFILGDRSLDAVFDNSKLKSIIPDYKQSISLEEGIKSTIEYYKQSHYLDGIDYVYDARVDRMLAKSGLLSSYQKQSLKFIDYIGTATLAQKVKYAKYRYVNDQIRYFIGHIISKIR